MSRALKESCLDLWLYELRLTTRAARKLAIASAGTESAEHYKYLIERNKTANIPPPRIHHFKY